MIFERETHSEYDKITQFLPLCVFMSYLDVYRKIQHQKRFEIKRGSGFTFQNKR